MTTVRPPMHGRDHRPGGADPIPFIEGSAVWGQINRSGAAGSLSITSGAISSTTTLVGDHDVVWEENGVDCDVVSSPSRITILEDGLYVIDISLTDLDTGSGDYALGLGRGLNTTGAVWSPVEVHRRVVSTSSTRRTQYIEQLSEGDFVTQVVGQNSGSTKTFVYLATFAVIKIPGPLAIGGVGVVDGGAP